MSKQARDSGQLLLEVLESSFESSRYSAKSIEAGLIISLGGAILLFIAFCFIRPRHSLIYAPKTKFLTGEKRPTPLGSNVISWMRKVINISEEELVRKLGLDAALFIRFLKMCRNMVLVLTLLVTFIGIPINVYYNYKSPSANDLQRLNDAFLLMTPSLISGTPLIAHVCISWAVDAVVMWFLWTNLTAVIRCKRRVYMTEEYQKALFMRTLMVTEIPKAYRTDRGLQDLMPGNPIQVKIGRDTRTLTELMDKYRHTVYKLESVLAKYLKHPDNLHSKRPTCRAKKTAGSVGGKEKVDAIDYYGALLQALESQIIAAREKEQDARCLAYGFSSYATQEECHAIALSESRARRKHGVLIDLAPRPKDIIWKNIVLSRLERGSKELWGNVMFAALLVAWIVPNAFIGCFIADISRLGQLWPAFKTFLESNPVIAAIFQGFISPLLTALIFLILPMILRRMSQWQGKVTKSTRDRNVIKKLYIFFFFNNFFVVTIIGVAWNVVSQIISLTNSSSATKKLSVGDALRELRLGQQIAPAIINASSFWVMYILRAYFAVVIDLLQWFNLGWKGFQRHLMAPTPRQMIKWNKPGSFNYPTNYNINLFYVTIALCFTSIQPIIMPILAVFLIVEVFIKKYTLMYMFVTKVESDGLYWPLAHKCLLFATGFGNIIMFAIVIVKGSWAMSIGMAPLPFIIAVFWYITSKKIHQRYTYFIPDLEEQEQLTQLLSSSSESPDASGSVYLEERYQNPAVTRALPVPMVHAKAQHLLPQACRFLDQGAQDNDEYALAYHANKEMMHSKGDVPFDIVADEQLDGLAEIGDVLRNESRMDSFDLSYQPSGPVRPMVSREFDDVYGAEVETGYGVLQGQTDDTYASDEDDQQLLRLNRAPQVPVPQNTTSKWPKGYIPYQS